MKQVQAMNSRILKITAQIQEQFPELYHKLNEMPAAIKLSESNKSLKVLNEYYESLVQVVEEYASAHRQTHYPNYFQPSFSSSLMQAELASCPGYYHSFYETEFLYV